MHTSKKPLLTNFTFLTFLFCSALIFWVPCAFATDYTWVKGSDGNWSETTSWNPEGVPNGDSDTATVETVADVTVTLDGNYSIAALTVGSGDGLTVGNGQILTIGDSGNGGTITNNGSIRIDATAGSTYLRANGVVMLNGSGSLELAHDTFAIVDSDGTYGGSFINGADHTIKGTGRILAAIDNNGEIVAQNGILQISAAVENTEGTMNAADAEATLRLSSTITGGMVNPEAGRVELNNTTLDNVAIGTGTVEVTNICTLLGNISSNSNITVNNGQILTIGDSGNGGTITNNGSIRIDATAGSTYLRANGVVTLNGSGSLELAHDTLAIVDSDGRFINGADHTR